MSPDVWGYLLAALTAAVSGLWISRSSNRANRITAAQQRQIEAVRVDGEAYTRAQEINIQMVRELRDEIGRLQRELSDLRSLLATAAQENMQLRSQIATLQRTVDRLANLLRQHDIPLPQEA